MYKHQESPKEAVFKSASKGSVESLIAVGCAYTEFGADNPEMFHLMWSAARHEDTIYVARVAGEAAYAGFITELTGICARNTWTIWTGTRSAPRFGRWCTGLPVC